MLSSIKKRLSIRSKSSSPIPNVSEPSTPETDALADGKMSKRKKTHPNLKDFKKSLSLSLASSLDQPFDEFGNGGHASLPNTPTLKKYVKKVSEESLQWDGPHGRSREMGAECLQNGTSSSFASIDSSTSTKESSSGQLMNGESTASSSVPGPGSEKEVQNHVKSGSSAAAAFTESMTHADGQPNCDCDCDDSAPLSPYDRSMGKDVDQYSDAIPSCSCTIVDDSVDTALERHKIQIPEPQPQSEFCQTHSTSTDNSNSSHSHLESLEDSPTVQSAALIGAEEQQSNKKDCDSDSVTEGAHTNRNSHKSLKCPDPNSIRNCVAVSSTCLNNNTTTEAINSPGIKPEFNEWQFWNDSTYCDGLIGAELGLGKENVRVREQEQIRKQGHGHGQDGSRVLTDYNGNDYVDATVNRTSNLGVDQQPEEQQQHQLSSSLYYLTPCAECSNVNANAARQTNPIKLITTGNCNSSSSSSCGHSRELIQIVDILFPDAAAADSDGSRMGNQSGKESKSGGSGGKSSKNALKHGDTKTTTIQATSNETSNVIIGPNTIVVQKPSKKLAPPPPPPAIRVQQSAATASRNNEKGNENNVNANTSQNHNEREPSLDFDPSSGSSDLLADSYLTAANGFSATGSYYSALGNLTTSQQEDVGDDDTLMNQSDQLSIDSVELIMPSITESNGNLNNLDDEGQVFQTSAAATAGSDINNAGPQRPMTTSFTLTRKRKVELSAVSSPVDEIPPAGPIGGRKDTTVSEQCLVGGDDSSYSQGSPIKTYGRYNSVSDVPYQESNVLRKVASLVLAEQQTAALKQSVAKPKFVPEKLDFKIYEKFEGQMLINWFISSFNDGHYLKDTLTMQDLKYLATQYCTLLLAAGVLKQIEEAETTPLDSIFRADLMYYWSHSESPAISTQVPGKLPPVSWPPANDTSSSAPRNGAKYTEADCGSRTLSPEHLPEPGTVPKTVSHFESECDLTRVVSATTSPTADVNGPEFQQMMMGLKREHKEILEKKVAQHEVDVFAVRGETVELLEKKYASRIEELEKEVETLRTLLSIQNLTNKVEADFASPTDGVAPPPPPPPAPMAAMPPPPPPPMAGMPPPPPPPMAGMPPPPPPPMGGPPPPPGMPSLGAGPPPPPMKIELRKKPVTPKVPMKPLYWTRIQITTPATYLVTEAENPKFSVEREDKENKAEPKLWEKIDEVSVGNWDDFTQLFAKQVTEKKQDTPDNSQSEDEVKKASKKPRQQTVSLLDQKRAQNLLIFVKSNKLEDISKIKSIIYNLELGDLKLETLEKILACKASDEEYALIKDQVDSNSEIALDPADRYLYDLHSIPKFADRITCFIFQFTFYESLSSIETKLNNFQLVCEKLVSSKDLQKVLALILTYGNYMNGGNTARGQADGFSLEILPQLRDVKSKENSYTFLHFIVATYVQMYDEFKGTTEAKLPTPEPSDIESAASIDFDAIQKDLNVLKKDLEDCEKRTQIVINSSTEENLEPFKTKMTEFLEQAKGKVQNIEETYEEGQRMYLTTMKFFDFNPNKKVAGKPIVCPPADFFTNWLRFCNDFKEIWKSEQQKILKEKIRESERFIQQKQSTFSKYFTKAPKKKGGLKDKLAQKMGK